MPLLSIDTRSNGQAPYARLSHLNSASEDDDSVLDVDEGRDGGPPRKKKPWWNYLPLGFMVVLLFAPHYSILVMLVSYFIQIRSSFAFFLIHICVIYTLTFLSCCSLLVCVVRDPGAVRVGEGAEQEPTWGQPTPLNVEGNVDDDDDADTDLRDALLMPVVTKAKATQEDDFNAPHKWCRKCWAPKPERTHHCSMCGRCVLKMDHHCPWLAQKCLGHWTYTAFLHFLFCITLLSSYVCILSSRIVVVAFFEPFLVNERTALHALFLTIYGAIFALVVGSFLMWHVYLVTTNQTTLENLSPFLLLRYLPSPSPDARSTAHSVTAAEQDTVTPRALDQIPREHQLSSAQRRHVRYAHGYIRLYDVGWRENWKQVIGTGSKGWKSWLYRIAFGGGGLGDGKTFPHNPRAARMLARLAAGLADEDKID